MSLARRYERKSGSCGSWFVHDVKEGKNKSPEAFVSGQMENISLELPEKELFDMEKTSIDFLSFMPSLELIGLSTSWKLKLEI